MVGKKSTRSTSNFFGANIYHVLPLPTPVTISLGLPGCSKVTVQTSGSDAWCVLKQNEPGVTEEIPVLFDLLGANPCQCIG